MPLASGPDVTRAALEVQAGSSDLPGSPFGLVGEGHGMMKDVNEPVFAVRPFIPEGQASVREPVLEVDEMVAGDT